MQWRNTSFVPDLRNGESYFCVRYKVTDSVGYKTIIGAKDIKAARAFFERHYSVGIHSIRSGKY